jgi:1-aminocyclopropane-1-carboxylate deaminase/D-cysteine desulfhydrase-like pyridoxal-dependent ACC family enzyme
LETFHELRDEHGIDVDLIYGAPSFAVMARHLKKSMDDAREPSSTISPDLSFDPNQPLTGREIMYVHSGGLEGINSQLLRYKYEGMVELHDVQVPGKNVKHIS